MLAGMLGTEVFFVVQEQMMGFDEHDGVSRTNVFFFSNDGVFEHVMV